MTFNIAFSVVFYRNETSRHTKLQTKFYRQKANLWCAILILCIFEYFSIDILTGENGIAVLVWCQQSQHLQPFWCLASKKGQMNHYMDATGIPQETRWRPSSPASKGPNMPCASHPVMYRQHTALKNASDVESVSRSFEPYKTDEHFNQSQLLLPP